MEIIYSIFLFALHWFKILNPVHDKELFTAVIISLLLFGIVLYCLYFNVTIYVNKLHLLVLAWFLVLITSFAFTSKTEFNTSPFMQQLNGVIVMTIVMLFYNHKKQRLMYAGIIS